MHSPKATGMTSMNSPVHPAPSAASPTSHHPATSSTGSSSVPSPNPKAPWLLPSWDVPVVIDSIHSRGVGFKRMDEDVFEPMNVAVATFQRTLFPGPSTDPDGDTLMSDTTTADDDDDELEDLATLASLRVELAKAAVARTHLSQLTCEQEQAAETQAHIQQDEANRATLAEIEARQAKVQALERQLDEKIEYEKHMARVRTAPSREETRRIIEAHEREIKGLKEQLAARTAQQAKERDMVLRAMHAILDLKDGLTDAVTERAVMRSELGLAKTLTPGKPAGK